MANTENIEAKLAAYVDDELDAAGRAEIEKHLASNPQHRELIAELKQMRGELRALPRVNAPPEVAEMLATHLERAALLGDVDIGIDSSSTSFSRWPQVRAIAAIVVITFGLAGALYYVLPSPKQNSIVTLVIPEQPPTAPAASEADRESAMMKSASPAPSAMARTHDKPEFDREPAHLTIETSDLAAANSTVTKYLQDNRIAWNARERQDKRAAGGRAPTTNEATELAMRSATGLATTRSLDAAPSDEIVAHMTTSQANALRDALSDSKQSAQLNWPEESASKDRRKKMDFGAERKPSATNPTNSSLEDDRVLSAGEMIRIRAHSASAPDNDVIDELVTVDSDGFIALPTAGRIAVAGESPRKLAEETIPQSMTQNSKSNLQQNVFVPMTWSVERVAQQPIAVAGAGLKDEAQPSTQPGLLGGAAVPTTGPTTEPTTAPATQPIDPTMHQLGATTEEEAREVVIVLRAVPSGSPTSAPATLPAATPVTPSLEEVSPPAAMSPTTAPTTSPSTHPADR